MKKNFLITVMLAMLVFIFAMSASAEVVTYDDAPVKDKLTVSTNDVVVFDDNFTCPSAYIFKNTDIVNAGNHTGIDGLKDSVDFSYINGKTGQAYDVSRIVELDIPEGIKELKGYGFTRLAIKRISIPKTVTTIGGCCFEKCKALEECVFEHTAESELQSLPSWIFQECINLKAFCFPECITMINAEYEFSGCTNLTAVYLPKKLTKYNTPGNDQKSVFWKCEKMYFVNEPFTYDNIPQKPAIYYMPSGLTSVSGEMFKQCKNLNETIVFPVGVTALTNGWAFSADSSTVKNVVFLGDMTALNTSSWKLADGGKIVFANANDVDSSSLSSLSGGHTKIYCASEKDLSKHVAKITSTTDATCLENKKVTSICFCGANMGTLDIEGTALGHEFDIADGAKALSVRYENYVENGFITTECARCKEETNEQQALNPIISKIKGYATSEDGKEITFGYDIDKDALAYYNELADSALELGFVVAVNAYLDGAPLNSNGTEATLAKGKVVKTVTNAVYSSVDFRLTGKWDNNVTIGDEETQLKYVELFIAGYIFDGAVNYVNNEGSSTEYTSVVAVTHTNKPVEA